MRNKKGFTLVEVMIVVAILGIIVAIAIPNFLAYRKRVMAKGKVEQNKVEDPMKISENSFDRPKIVCVGGYKYIVYKDSIIQYFKYDKYDDNGIPVECEGGYE